jgi:hypothetical protein
MPKEKANNITFDEADIQKAIDKAMTRPSGQSIIEIACGLIDMSHQMGSQVVEGRTIPVFGKKYCKAWDGSLYKSMNFYSQKRKEWETQRKALILSAVEEIKAYLLKTCGEIIRDKSDRPIGFKNGGYCFVYKDGELEPNLVPSARVSNASGF